MWKHSLLIKHTDTHTAKLFHQLGEDYRGTPRRNFNANFEAFEKARDRSMRSHSDRTTVGGASLAARP